MTEQSPLSDFQRGVVAERERVTRIIREQADRGYRAGDLYSDALLVALGVEDNQPGTRLLCACGQPSAGTFERNGNTLPICAEHALGESSFQSYPAEDNQPTGGH